MFEIPKLIPDFALVVFAGIGLFFTFRAWQQREDDLHEKYFERRYDLFKSIIDPVSKALTPSGADFQWYAELAGKKERVRFLFGEKSEEQFVQLFDLLIEYQGALENEDTTTRVAEAKKFRRLATDKANELRESMAKKIEMRR